MTYRRKLIEVALPLEAINAESAREKSVRHGHPSTLHLWWARRPLAACRAVLFASLVDDPGEEGAPAPYLEALDRLPEPRPLPEDWDTLSLADQRRARLFYFMAGPAEFKDGSDGSIDYAKTRYPLGLVAWEQSNDERVIEQARQLILLSTEGKPPPVLDPFCGGGSIPLEAQRLGLEAHASDLNPVAVLITKALIEIPPRFANLPPVNLSARGDSPTKNRTTQSSVLSPRHFKGAAGLAADVRHYGQWMRDEAEQRIGHLYPKATLPDGTEATVIAWLWARTVRCPNPACGVAAPLVRSFALSTKAGAKAAAIPTVVNGHVRFTIERGGTAPEGTVGRTGARCVACNVPIPFDYIRSEGRAGRMRPELMAIVAEGSRSRVYLPPDDLQTGAAAVDAPPGVAESELPDQALGFRVQIYGMTRHRDLFTPRQLVALTTFSDLVGEARERVLADARSAGLPDDGLPLAEGGRGATGYADAVATYLAFAVGKAANRNSSLCIWETKMDRLVATFGRQALPMVWDYAETNPFAGAGGDLLGTVESLCEVLDRLGFGVEGSVQQADARTVSAGISAVATDPPYYDNIGYADLSDFFYVWLRRALVTVHPALFRTVLTPKASELIASPYRFGGSKQDAEAFFRRGLAETIEQLTSINEPSVPMTLFYAFKQADQRESPDPRSSESGLVSSTGWETFLQGMIDAGLAVTGTWPMRTEQPSGLRAIGQNSLASSIVLACRPRPADAARVTRGQFVSALRAALPAAIVRLTRGGIAPVDLAQAAIGPGMAVFSSYGAVLEADGGAMRVRTALQIINQVLDETMVEPGHQYDDDTRWAIDWFSQHAMEEGPFGDAETLAKAKGVSVPGLERAGLLRSRGGKVQLLARTELPADWDPRKDTRLTTWESTQHLVRALEDAGEDAAARLLAALGGHGEAARDLSYRLFQLCERKGWTKEAQSYNALAIAWPALAQRSLAQASETQGGLI